MATKTTTNTNGEYSFDKLFGNATIGFSKDKTKFVPESFATDAARIIRWKAFLKKIQWKETLNFETVMEVLRERLQPMAEKYWEK